MKRNLSIVMSAFFLAILITFWRSGSSNPIKDSGNTIAPAKNPPVPSESTSEFVGSWRSGDDEKYKIIFESNHMISEIYDGKELNQGTWNILQDLGVDGAKFGEFAMHGGPFLSLIRNGENYFYKIQKIDAKELVLIYLERGNILVFQKI